MEPQPASLLYKGAALFPNMVLQVSAFLFSTTFELHTSASMLCWGGISKLELGGTKLIKVKCPVLLLALWAVPPSPQNQAQM